MSIPAPDEIARQEQRRLVRAVGSIAPVAEPIAGGVMCRGRPGSWMNKAVGLGMGVCVGDSDIARLVSFYEGAGLEARVEVCPYADASLLRGLASAGFVVRRVAQVMAREVGGADQSARAPGVEVRAVDREDEGAMRLMARTAHAGFVGPAPEATDDELRVWMVSARRAIPVLATVEGEPAGAGFVEVDGAYSTLFAASVLERFRRRGVQGAMIAERLRLAGAGGASYATVSSEVMGATERNARRAGFAPVYTHLILARPGPGLVPVGG